jgi:hypothetical protein
VVPPASTPVAGDYDHRWDAVAQCESHWVTAWGPTYYGYLGETEGSWVEYGGLQYAANPAEATMAQQVAVGEVIEGSFVPDQDGACHGW